MPTRGSTGDSWCGDVAAGAFLGQGVVRGLSRMGPTVFQVFQSKECRFRDGAIGNIYGRSE